jgi:hypothetical protein
MIPGLVRAYELSGNPGDPTYKASAELAGTWVLNRKSPPVPNPFDPAIQPGWTSHNLLGEENYAFRRLSEIAANPSSNLWRTEITNYYDDVRLRYTGGPIAYTSYFRSFNDPSVATDVIAHWVVAADYVQTVDLPSWRTALVNSLATVSNAANFPVMALGSAVWALASTAGGLDHTQVDPSATFGTTWWIGDIITGRPAELLDLPGILASHQELTPGANWYGTFYWRFDHLAPPGEPGYGYTEDTVFGALGLQASALYGYGPYDTQVNAAIYALLGGFAYWDNYMKEHVGFSAYVGYNFMYAAEGLRLAIPEPCSMILLAGGCAALILKRRRRLAGKVSD